MGWRQLDFFLSGRWSQCFCLIVVFVGVILPSFLWGVCEGVVVVVVFWGGWRGWGLTRNTNNEKKIHNRSTALERSV